MEGAEEGDAAEEFVHRRSPAVMMNDTRAEQYAEVGGLGADGEGSPVGKLALHQLGDRLHGVGHTGHNDGLLRLKAEVDGARGLVEDGLDDWGSFEKVFRNHGYIVGVGQDFRAQESEGGNRKLQVELEQDAVETRTKSEPERGHPCRTPA